jgi:A nuclease of the HNH/ENDO VII superfamily with conserved WHH
MFTPSLHKPIFKAFFQQLGSYFPFLKPKTGNSSPESGNKYPPFYKFGVFYWFALLFLAIFFFAVYTDSQKSDLENLKQSSYQGLSPEDHLLLCELLAKVEGIYLSEDDCKQAGNWYAVHFPRITETERKAEIEKLPLVNGEKIINANQAGNFVRTPSGFEVFIKPNGFPDFTPYSIKNVQIEMKGNHDSDFSKANQAVGFGKNFLAHRVTENGKYKDYTWHHHEDGKTMQLVPQALNNTRNGGLYHTGGVAVCKHNSLYPDNQLHFSSPKIKENGND